MSKFKVTRNISPTISGWLLVSAARSLCDRRLNANAEYLNRRQECGHHHHIRLFQVDTRNQTR